MSEVTPSATEAAEPLEPPHAPLQPSPIAPEVDSIQSGREPVASGSAALRKWLPAIGIVAVLGLPAGYLLLHHTSGTAAASAQTSEADKAIPALEELVRTQPTESNRLNLSLAYIQANRPSSAIPVLEALVRDEPKDAKAWNNLCVAHNMQSEFNLALDACHSAISADPGFQLAQNNLHWAEAQAQKERDVVAALDALPTSQRSEQSYLDEGLHLLHVGDYDRAIEVWGQVLASDPQSALAANDIGVAYMMKQLPADAAPYFQKAVAIEPGMQLARNNLAWAESQLSSAGHSLR